MHDPFVGFQISCDWTCHVTRTPPSSGGTDYRMGTGTPIRAAFSGYLTNRPPVQFPNSGLVAILTAPAALAASLGVPSLAFYHLHLSAFVTPGWVNENDIIGYSGNSGFSTGPHLHANAYVGNTPRDIHDFFPSTTTAGGDSTPILPTVEKDYDMPRNLKTAAGTVFTLGENFAILWTSATSFSYQANIAAYGDPILVSMTSDQVVTIVNEANARGARAAAVTAPAAPIDIVALAAAIASKLPNNTIDTAALASAVDSALADNFAAIPTHFTITGEAK